MAIRKRTITVRNSPRSFARIHPGTVAEKPPSKTEAPVPVAHTRLTRNDGSFNAVTERAKGPAEPAPMTGGIHHHANRAGGIGGDGMCQPPVAGGSIPSAVESLHRYDLVGLLSGVDSSRHSRSLERRVARYSARIPLLARITPAKTPIKVNT